MVTIDSKSRAFQFKINHNFYYTNKKLHQAAIKNTTICSFCKTQEETLRYLFIECKFVQHIWNDLQTLLNESFSDDEKLFGKYRNIDDKTHDLISHITIIVKQSIHTSRLECSSPSFQSVKAKIRSIESLERHIAVKNSKLEQHNNKWKNVSTLLTERKPLS